MRRFQAGQNSDEPAFRIFFGETFSLLERVEHFGIAVIVEQQIDPKPAIPRPVRKFVDRKRYPKPVTADETDGPRDTAGLRVGVRKKSRAGAGPKLMGDVQVGSPLYFDSQVIAPCKLGIPDRHRVPGQSAHATFGKG